MATYQSGVIIGKSGYGKTTLAETIVAKYVKEGGLVWCVDPNNAWGPDKITGAPGVEGVRSVWDPYDLEPIFHALEKAPPGMVIFDDGDMYLRHSAAFKLAWLTSYRHFRKHVITIARRAQNLPPDAISNADWLAIFRQREKNGLERITQTIGEEEAAKIPTKPFTYLYLRDDEEGEVLKTKPRPGGARKSDIQ